MRIALDGMGSDAYPQPEVLGALAAVREFGWHIILTGNETQLRSALTRAAGAQVPKNISVEHAPERLTHAERPAFASRQKTKNSIARGLELVKTGRAWRGWPVRRWTPASSLPNDALSAAAGSDP